MSDRFDQYLARAEEFEEKAATEELNPDLKTAYLEIARSYRVLIQHREKSGLN